MSAEVVEIEVLTLLTAPSAPTITPAGVGTPANVTVGNEGTPGATAYSYKVVAVIGSVRGLPSTAGSTATGAAALDGTDFNRITWDPVTSATAYDVYRTAGGATQGLIGTVTGDETFDDTGLAGDAASPPAATNYSYKVVALGVDDRHTEASSAGSTATGYPTLTATNKLTVDWSAVTGATGYRVYRTVGGATQGLIAETSDAVTILNDTGLAASGAAPTTNDTGESEPFDVLHLKNKTVQFGGTFTATVQLQGSVNGSDWTNEGSAATAVGVIEVSETYAMMRAKMTAYTSGAPTVHVAGSRGR